jgi:regulator of sigma E protease
MFDRPKQVIRHYGVWGSVKAGVAKTYGTVAEIVLSIRGMARREVSSKNLGSIIVIAQSSYLAAQEGIGKLLYLTAVISAALAFLNILPIPILDGGHLLFVAIEKVRGRPVSEKVMAISQYVGLTLLLALVFYAIANDIMRFIG